MNLTINAYKKSRYTHYYASDSLKQIVDTRRTQEVYIMDSKKSILAKAVLLGYFFILFKK